MPPEELESSSVELTERLRAEDLSARAELELQARDGLSLEQETLTFAREFRTQRLMTRRAIHGKVCLN